MMMWHILGVADSKICRCDRTCHDRVYGNRSDRGDFRHSDIFNTLTIFLRQAGKTQQICEYLITEIDNSDLRHALLSSE